MWVMKCGARCHWCPWQQNLVQLIRGRWAVLWYWVIVGKVSGRSIVGRGHTGHNLGSYEGFTQYVVCDGSVSLNHIVCVGMLLTWYFGGAWLWLTVGFLIIRGNGYWRVAKKGFDRWWHHQASTDGAIQRCCGPWVYYGISYRRVTHGVDRINNKFSCWGRTLVVLFDKVCNKEWRRTLWV